MPTKAAEKLSEALEILNLPIQADRETVRQAFRKLAFSCHPDLHAGDPKKARRFKRLLEAYRIALAEAAPRPDPSAEPKPVAGRDIHFRLDLDFRHAALGGEIPVRFERPVTCPRCKGNPKFQCSRCESRREEMQETVLQIQVPAGIEEGEVIRLHRRGGEGRFGGEAGDVYLLASIRSHPEFDRRGLDIHSDVEVPAARLDGGGNIRVKTLYGIRQVFLLPMTQPGKIAQLQGEGINSSRGGRRERGDHFVRILKKRAG